jgi:hypothetical protein
LGSPRAAQFGMPFSGNRNSPLSRLVQQIQLRREPSITLSSRHRAGPLPCLACGHFVTSNLETSAKAPHQAGEFLSKRAQPFTRRTFGTQVFMLSLATSPRGRRSMIANYNRAAVPDNPFKDRPLFSQSRLVQVAPRRGCHFRLRKSAICL